MFSLRLLKPFNVHLEKIKTPFKHKKKSSWSAFFAGKIDWAYFLRYVWFFDKLVNSLKKGNLIMKKFFAEVIGTFMLVFIGTGAVVLEMGQKVLDI